MLGPEGLALFYCRAELRERLRLQQFGWHMVEHRGDYDRPDWQVATDARRFECGSPNMLGIHGLHASLSLLLEVGIESVSRKILGNIQYLHELFELNGFDIISPQAHAQRSGIATFRVPGKDIKRLHGALMQRRVVCALRGGGIRFSPHFHTDKNQLERAVSIVDEIVKSMM